MIRYRTSKDYNNVAKTYKECYGALNWIIAERSDYSGYLDIYNLEQEIETYLIELFQEKYEVEIYQEAIQLFNFKNDYPEEWFLSITLKEKNSDKYINDGKYFICDFELTYNKAKNEEDYLKIVNLFIDELNKWLKEFIEKYNL